MTQIVPGLFIGNLEASRNRQMLEKNHINAIVSLHKYDELWTASKLAGIRPHRHKLVQCADSTTQNILVHLTNICDFIDKMASPVLSSMDSLPVLDTEKNEVDKLSGVRPPALLVHCKLGMSRSATIIIAYLMRKFRMKLLSVLQFVRAREPWVKPSPAFTNQLQVWEDVGYDLWQDEAKKVPKAPYRAYLKERAIRLKQPNPTKNEALAAETPSCSS